MKRIGYAQFSPVLGDLDANRRRVGRILHDIEADLVVLPELAFSGYCIKDRSSALVLAEDAGSSRSLDMLSEICAQGKYHVVAGFAEKDGEAVYNSAALVGPDGLIGVYRKIHLFNFESELFDPGGEPPEVYDVDGMKVGMMICFDWFFPETARLLALAGAEVIAHPANLVLDWCQRSMVTRCLENNLFAVTANRWGTEFRGGQEVRFTGASQITAPRANILASGPIDSDDVQIVEIDPSEARDKMVTTRNHLLNDRRPELYGRLVE
ncbi:MAG: hypothetical protein P1P77_01645 [Spirochaetaceae bacterium]|nr:hypothetical protein [Spirochaetaceae bacterium]